MLNDYEENTIGYHMQYAKVFLGEDSPAVAFLQKKADDSPNGLLEKVVVPEPQVINLLMNIHNKKAVA